MKLTIQNIDKINQYAIQPEYDVQYRIDRIVQLPDSYRFHYKRFSMNQVIMVTLDRTATPLDGLFTLRIGTTSLGISHTDIKHINHFLSKIETIMKMHSLDVNLNNC